MNKKWTFEEERFIAENYGKYNDIEMAELLSEISRKVVSVNSVKKKRQRMGFPKLGGRSCCRIKQRPSLSFIISGKINV